MTNVEKVIKAIEEREFTITQNPFKALIDMYDRELKFVGTVLSFEYRSSLGVHEHTIFINDKEDSNIFHNGFSLLGGNDLPSVIWFKEPYDKITRYEGLYI